LGHTHGQRRPANAVSTSLPRWLVRVGPTLAYRSAANDSTSGP